MFLGMLVEVSHRKNNFCGCKKELGMHDMIAIFSSKVTVYLPGLLSPSLLSAFSNAMLTLMKSGSYA
jgi:hypothetical protein